MGLFKLMQYRKHKRRRKELKTDMLAVALQEAVTSSMNDRRFLDAMKLIKEIWKLKTNPWTYSTSIVNYIECLIRKKRFREIALLEKELLRFYTSVLNMSPRRLMSFAHEVMTISSSSRALHAALLSFYAALIAQTTLTKKPAMKLAGESINFMKSVVECMKEELVVREYLLALMRELRDYLNATRTKRKEKFKSECLEHCQKLINETKKELAHAKAKAAVSETEQKTVKRRKHLRQEKGPFYDLQSGRAQSYEESVRSSEKSDKKRLRESVSEPKPHEASAANQSVCSANDSKYSEKSKRTIVSGSASEAALSQNVTTHKNSGSVNRMETVRKKRLSGSSMERRLCSSPHSVWNQQSIHRAQKTPSCSSSDCEVRSVSSESARNSASTLPLTHSDPEPAIPDAEEIPDTRVLSQSSPQPHLDALEAATPTYYV